MQRKRKDELVEKQVRLIKSLIDAVLYRVQGVKFQ